MAFALMMLFQAATAEPSALDGAGRDWGVKIVPERRCASGDDEIVVCGARRDDRYRLPPLSSEFETGPLKF